VTSLQPDKVWSLF